MSDKELKMNKKKHTTLYLFLGILSLVMINYPMLAYFKDIQVAGFPFVLIYLCLIALLISLSAYFLNKKDK